MTRLDRSTPTYRADTEPEGPSPAGRSCGQGRGNRRSRDRRARRRAVEGPQAGARPGVAVINGDVRIMPRRALRETAAIATPVEAAVADLHVPAPDPPTASHQAGGTTPDVSETERHVGGMRRLNPRRGPGRPGAPVPRRGVRPERRAIAGDTETPTGAERHPAGRAVASVPAHVDAGPAPEGPVVACLLRASIGSHRPASIAARDELGSRAEAALEAAVVRLSRSPAAARLILDRALVPGFLGPAMRSGAMTAITGAALGWEASRLSTAAAAAILADVGMLDVPRQIVHKPGLLSDAERWEVERHPQMGAALLRPLADEVDPLLPVVALQHHERVDGGGYPHRLRGPSIHAEAQVVACCQLYLAARSGRAYRPPLSPHMAQEMIMRATRDRLDGDIGRAFCESISPYPVGAVVRLSSGECGRVLGGGDPHRPAVRILWGADGRELRGRDVDLSREPALRIAAVSE